MNFLIRLLLSALAVIIVSYLLPGVYVEDFLSAVIIALILSVLNQIVKPILILLTIPLTILSLGLFLLVINALIILMADAMIPGFNVDGFWWAVLCSLLLSLTNALLTDISGTRKEK